MSRFKDDVLTDLALLDSGLSAAAVRDGALSDAIATLSKDVEAVLQYVKYLDAEHTETLSTIRSVREELSWRIDEIVDQVTPGRPHVITGVAVYAVNENGAEKRHFYPTARDFKTDGLEGLLVLGSDFEIEGVIATFAKYTRAEIVYGDK